MTDRAGRSDIEGRFIGSLLGTAFGDALGAPVEGMSRRAIRERFAEVRDFIPGKRGFGRYTDDTQMTLALARSMVRTDDVTGGDCARSYAEMFDPSRGYGGGTAKILRALKAGANYRRTGRMVFPEGSFGNGAAMRIAPVGLVFDPENSLRLRQKVRQAVCCTHVHPEAIDGATVQAMAIGFFSRHPADGIPEGELLARLEDVCRTGVMRRALEKVSSLLEAGAGEEEAVRVLGTGVGSAESVPAALFIAWKYARDPETAIIKAVNLGGDADTIGAMTGAIVGALHGTGWFPSRWYDNLENGRDGRDQLVQAARSLAAFRTRLLP